MGLELLHEVPSAALPPPLSPLSLHASLSLQVSSALAPPVWSIELLPQQQVASVALLAPLVGHALPNPSTFRIWQAC